ncbi:hypothetical protein [Thermoflavimicrobium dichotomicum]|uniref:Uncharacterized protein n=1 Tax=Thermoflavimicrobium dichotomicum TaxID=46223 RepID=A0A1I3U6X3_9BACL|nr:hypothetical protein [Thermoflavimicrobium dichotomicum]SFJ78329.1 hypothetical protein SAMN05421852_12214 [Thermoflavimicrobium dichotomicum]
MCGKFLPNEVDGKIYYVLQAIDAFKMGYKPMLLATESELDELLFHPFFIRHKHLYLFFHSEAHKRGFLKKTKGIPWNSLEFERILGLCLGMPPKAVDLYIRVKALGVAGKFEKMEELIKKRIGISFAGITCVCHVEDLVENAHWFWERYDFPELMQYPLEVWSKSDFHFVNYGDTTKLKEIQKEILEGEWRGS